MTANDFVAQTLTEMTFISEQWTDLLEARQPGTARPWRQALLDPDRRAAMALRDREERATRDPDAPGFTSAPQHIDVLDVIVEVWTTLDELAAAISPDWNKTPAGSAIRKVTEIAPLTEFIGTWLPELGDDLPPGAARAANRLQRLTGEVSRVLSLVRAGQLLSAAVCPWCRGVTPKHPAGGAITLRVEEIPGKPANEHRPAVEPAAAVVCWNPLCDPPDEDCGVRYRGRPGWPWHEWEWLAKRLLYADPPVSLPIKPTFWDDLTIYPVVHSGRSGVDQAVAIVPPRNGVPAPAREHPGRPVRFVGGPFHRQLRRFITIDDVLVVDRPENSKRPRLSSRDAATRPIGEYQFEIVNEQPSYVWVAASKVSA